MPRQSTKTRKKETAKKKKQIKSIPSVPKLKIDKLKEIYKKNQVILIILELQEFFKSVERLEKVRENTRQLVILRKMIY